MYDDYERVKLLFDYTKFHIGVYLTLASTLVAVIGLKKDLQFDVEICFIIASVLSIMIAGLSGGTIVSRLTQVKTYDEFWNEATGPFRLKLFKGENWTYIEHVSFWIGLLLAFAAFIIPFVKLCWK